MSIVRIEDTNDLVGHSGMTVTETVYRHEIRPALITGATAMDKILTQETNPGPAPHGRARNALADLQAAVGGAGRYSPDNVGKAAAPKARPTSTSTTKTRLCVKSRS